MIAFIMVVIAYVLGHLGGYRMCKQRVKNMLRKKIFSYHHTYPNRTDVLDGMQHLLREVVEL